jgi:hypothetical protein
MNKITKSFFAALCILALGQNIKTSESEQKHGDSEVAIFTGFDGVDHQSVVAEGMTHDQFLNLVRAALGLAPDVVFEVALVTDDGVENLADPAVFVANPGWYSESPFMVMTAADIAAAHAHRVAAAAAAAIRADYANSDSDSEESEEEDDSSSDVAEVEGKQAESDDEDSHTSGELIQENFDAEPTG